MKFIIKLSLVFLIIFALNSCGKPKKNISPIKETTFGSYKAVIPEVTGTAFVTGKNEFWIDPEDPLKHGFILR